MRKDHQQKPAMMKQILELSDTTFKAAIIIMFQQASINTLEANLKNRKSVKKWKM